MDFSQFHFIRPLWLLLIPTAVLMWLVIKRNSNAGQWQKYMPAEMIAALKVGADQQTTRNSVLMLIASLLLIAALAGPSWMKQPVPTLQNQHAMVVLLDLSPSMMAQDLQPNRLTLARFKLIDILRQQQDGQIALIAYSGGAHTVSPLTDDPRTIEALLPALHPIIIPSSGSNVEAAVDLALKLLRDAGAAQGDLLLITDGVANDAISEMESRIPANIRLSILGVGGDQPTPIPAQGGGFVKSASGEIVLAELNENQLQKLASKLGGKYARLASDDSDTSRLIFDSVEALPSLQNKESTFDSWIDMGYWLALLVLPLALLWFRKGVIYLLPLMFIAPFDSQAQYSSISSAWQKLWSTPDQQAAKLMQQERFAEAANTFKRDDWSAIANYKAGNYAEAAEALANKDDATSLYNRANATALAGDLDAAQELYEKVLEKQPDHPDAAHNKKVIEEIKKQQKESQSQQGDGEQNQEQDQNQQNEQQSGDQSQQQNQSAEQENEQSADSEQQSDQAPDEQQSQSAENSESESSGSENKGEEDQQSEQANETEQGEEQTESETTKPSEQEQESEGSEESQLAAQATDETPLDDASEQWLRSVKDDPSGLLRRKFEHQAKERARKAARTQQPAPTDQRY